ncbi:anthranilate phosphoribosyltransferase [Methanobrevibacter olleyae]|uniref:Anthranilate phosphoribosyltransferase n=1 Tax=Methanobrevibacter olleyae TaxID=294671 RepID=A0A126R1U7_METOL|nr:anthranilate phosphoribosyltransferase [Methanobrevibacter olleyae]AMK16383.1 anthranilate phosphoribosyltransferase TrpD [Methanobrevibacter olleyae]SFL50342.1 anthranilate phosphoribosyltransferase [Methanobrevibacter olleyae]
MTFIEDAILKLSNKEDLSFELAKGAMDEIMRGEATNVQISSYLTALSFKGETIDEISGSAVSMRNNATRLECDMPTLEIVGTGGDSSNSFNISTTSAFVISAAGVPVTKHGNRSASSKCGAADVLEALGVNINLDPKESFKILNEIGMSFLFAQKYHSAMKYVAPVRSELGIKTIFNILGPLANPAFASYELMGVYSEELVEPLANVLNNIGVNAMVVYGQDGLDEISASAPTTVCEVRNGELLKYTIKPEDFGFKSCSKEDLVGGDSEFNAQITRNILSGEMGPKRNVVLLNSGAALYLAGKVNTIEEGVELAEDIIDRGLAKKQLNEFIRLSNA